MVRLVRGDCPVAPFGERPSATAVQCGTGEGIVSRVGPQSRSLSYSSWIPQPNRTTKQKCARIRAKHKMRASRADIARMRRCITGTIGPTLITKLATRTCR